MRFREAYLLDHRQRMFDLSAHLLSSGALTIAQAFVGSPYYQHPILYVAQWFPDVMLLVIWPYSMITDNWLRPHNPLLLIHRALHSPFIVLALAIATIFVSDEWIIPLLAVLVNWIVHLTIDYFTHEESR